MLPEHPSRGTAGVCYNCDQTIYADGLGGWNDGAGERICASQVSTSRERPPATFTHVPNLP